MNPGSFCSDLACFPGAQCWPPEFPPACASAWGDDQYGLWINVVIAGPVQRFRWIEPGEFVMGAPAGEPERRDDEGPLHVVRLTEGFWLADTACSQAVWEAVMVTNPSHFTDDPQNPVEQLSWDGVSRFLSRLDEMLSGVRVSLPTEAEWEYACRAGANEAFSWGNDTITPQQANYNGSYAYAGGVTGEYRGKTVPVKSFAPNAWGLYQMHGNVWEWCADGHRIYDNETQTNPRGPEKASRVVRGGAWILDPEWLRAARHHERPRAFRSRIQGFRFSLRSTAMAGWLSERSIATVPVEEGS